MTAGPRRRWRQRVPGGLGRARLGRVELVIIGALLAAGAILRPVAGMVPGSTAVAPQYARPAVTVWFALADTGYLVPVARRVAQDEVTPRTAVAELLRGPQAGPDLEPVFAHGAALTGFGLSADRASVELSAGALDGVDRGQAIDALVLTLTETPGISGVSLSVGGDPLDGDGSVSARPVIISRPVVNPEDAAAAGGGLELTFAWGTGDRYLVPVTRAAALPDREPATAIREMLAGPRPGSGLEPALPLDVGVHGVSVENGLATVDFDAHLVYAYRLSKANAMFVRRAVMATLTRLPGISAGLIEIDGSRLLLYTCVNVTQEYPQARPWAINDEFYLSTLEAPASASGPRLR
jgi:germination protein M